MRRDPLCLIRLLSITADRQVGGYFLSVRFSGSFKNHLQYTYDFFAFCDMVLTIYKTFSFSQPSKNQRGGCPMTEDEHFKSLLHKIVGSYQISSDTAEALLQRILMILRKSQTENGGTDLL